MSRGVREYKNLFLNFGPQHPAAHGVLRLIIELEGERVWDCDPHIGLLHRGTEKLLEYKKNILQCIPYFDRLDYVSAMSQEHTFVMTIEKLCGIENTFLISKLRVVLLELTRILNHLLAITTHALDVGALSPFLWMFEEREELLTLFERLSGSRLHYNFITIGGFIQTFPFGFFSDVVSFVERFCFKFKKAMDILSSNRIWKQRLIDIGIIGYLDCMKYGMSGVMLRGSGVCWDLRKNVPYEFYDKIFFSIFTGKYGDCFDRYVVRVNEVLESLRLIENILIDLSSSDIFDLYRVSNDRLFEKASLKLDMESLISHFKSYTEGVFFNKNIGRETSEIIGSSSYSVTETPKGELGVFISIDNVGFISRCHIKSPGFLHLASLKKLLKGSLLADLVAIIGTIDIVFGEVDR